jgi:hypothetical protein
VDLPGRFQGELKVHVCLDPACGSELAGSPVKVPFDVIVKPGITVDRDAIQLALPFGEVPPEQTVRVTFPPDMSGEWFVTEFWPAEFNVSVPLVNWVRSTSPDASGGTLTLKINPEVPGTHRTTYQLTAFVRHSDGREEPTRKTVTLRYDVAQNPELPYVFYPAAGSYTRVFGDFASVPTGDPMLAWVPTQLLGVEYLSQPEAAKGHMHANGWYRPASSSIIPCAGASPQECLPPGTYVARARYSVSLGSRTEDAFWPVTLEVLPR